MPTGKIYFKDRQRRPRTLKSLIALRAYAQQQFVDESTVRNWIAQRRIVGYRIKGRWYIEPDSRFRVPLYDRNGSGVGISTDAGTCS